jgi:hypothetical protein
MSGGEFISPPRPGDAKRPRWMSGGEFISPPRPGDAKRPRWMSGGEFISPPRKIRAGVWGSAASTPQLNDAHQIVIVT